jgi:hypothetical protein
MWALSAALFVTLATANAAGYRYGASDQAFYIPAVAMSQDAALFPRDRALFEPQMRFWPGGSVLGALAGPEHLPSVFGGLYLATLLVLFVASVSLARALAATDVTVAAFLALLTLKHQITRTGANSLEGYGHPRMLAFALGVAALACLVRERRMTGTVALIAALGIHVTTALWFTVVIVVAALWRRPRRLAAVVLFGGAAGAGVLAFTALGTRLVVMDPEWLAAIGDRSYLFSGEWPLAVWLLNLGYAVVLTLIYWRRRQLGSAVTAEAGLVVGLLSLVVVFLASVPLTELRLALAVQLQVNRIFWLLDIVVAFYLAWWFTCDLARAAGPRFGWAFVAVIVLASAARGFYLLEVAPARPAVEPALPASAWTDAMSWLRRQPEHWHVLADPQHAVRFGSSVRVAALRDTLLEAGKDPALAIYDSGAARRVLERTRALEGFDQFTTADVQALATKYHLDVLVDRPDRVFALPILYRNDGFIVYDLR